MGTKVSRSKRFWNGVRVFLPLFLNPQKNKIKKEKKLKTLKTPCVPSEYVDR